MSIEVLSSEVINQIAAGEVVERPAHLVKELVENSLDANAKKVTVEFGQGGRYIKVVDDGDGIPEKDLAKAIERFATSKISKTEDLWNLHSFGFRGEALASIAAVSDLQLISKTNAQSSAYQLVAQYGKILSVDAVSGVNGTSLLIENLFENVPARLKFLKTASAEHGQIKLALKALALAHPNVEFKLIEEGKLLHLWPACENRKQRMEQILELAPVYEAEKEFEHGNVHLVFASPHEVAKSSRHLWIFVQNRWVQDKTIQAAIMEAYRTLLMHGEYPMVCAWVEVDPQFLDINIHPTKSQIKFQEPAKVFRAVQSTLRESLEKAPWLPQTHSSTQNQYVSESFVPMPTSNLTFSEPSQERIHYSKRSISIADLQRLSHRNQSEWGQTKATPEISMNPISQVPKEIVSETESIKNKYWSLLDVLGQANLTYIICQSEDKLVFVDQHAAHERVVFERLMQTWKSGNVERQDFLFPLAIDIDPEKCEPLKAQLENFLKMGIEMEMLGPHTLGVKSAPLWLKENALVKAVQQVADEVFLRGESFSLEKIITDVFASMACHSVVRAGQPLSIDQMKSLLVDMDEFPLSSFCPHGRPVCVEYSFNKLEKDFGRIV